MTDIDGGSGIWYFLIRGSVQKAGGRFKNDGVLYFNNYAKTVMT